jgi:5-formyltetrahydrofolate cyclo-ligase
VPEDEATEGLRYRAKAQIRARMRALRAAVPAPARAARSRAIVDRLAGLSLFRAGARVALFWPILERGEVDLTLLDSLLRSRGLDLYYPFMKPPPEGDGFAPVRDPGDLEDRGHGFREPLPSAPPAGPGELDVIVAPALAVAPDGHRLGYGAGFYDRLLPRFRPPATILVVAFDFQLLGELPHTAGDVPADGVVTDARLLYPIAG